MMFTILGIYNFILTLPSYNNIRFSHFCGFEISHFALQKIALCFTVTYYNPQYN